MVIVFNLDSGKEESSLVLDFGFKGFEHELLHFLQVKCAFGAVRISHNDGGQLLVFIYT